MAVIYAQNKDVIERSNASFAMDYGGHLIEEKPRQILVSQFFDDDQNADGSVKYTEVIGVLRSEFDLFDGNNDGQISLYEVKKSEKTRVSKDEKVQESRKTAEKRS